MREGGEGKESKQASKTDKPKGKTNDEPTHDDQETVDQSASRRTDNKLPRFSSCSYSSSSISRMKRPSFALRETTRLTRWYILCGTSTTRGHGQGPRVMSWRRRDSTQDSQCQWQSE